MTVCTLSSARIFRVATPVALMRMALVVLAGLCLTWASLARAAEDFLEPEKAFKFSARMASEREVEVSFAIAPGYYLYRERLAFAVDGAAPGEPKIPAGKIKFDENFQKNVETLRGELRIALPLVAVNGPFTLRVTSQGCADAGLCYPPQVQQARLDPSGAAATPVATQAATGPAPSAAPRGFAAWRDGSIVDEALQGGRFWTVVGVFLAVGVMLSLTPCVLPMLPILSSIIVGTQERPSRLRGLALASSYSLGMALVYTALGVAAGLAGEGFAAALQTPWAIGAFALLLVLFSLSMFDVYELRLPARFTSKVSTQCNRLPAGQLAGVFMMGGVSALIVSPCVTAPLAGALLFISQSRDLVLGGGALFAMAAGMSVPLLVMGVSSGTWLPRAGPWMQAVKRLFGALMLGLAIWLAQPVLPAGVVLALWGVLLLLVGLMLKPFKPGAGHRHALRAWGRRALGLAALLMGTVQIVGAATGGRDALMPLAHLGEGDAQARAALRFTRVRSVAELDAALASAQRPVMLDFYADWCVSCKEMERFTFRHAEVAARLDKVLLLKADVTDNTEADRALLRRFKLFGPPGTLFFDAQGREISDARVIGFQGAGRFRRTLDQAGL
ncbi:protein-disulfide reductase DsbD [Aquabacterium sp.]|uniref:protein-disulfide reductase DsbD n=1 Tax=Aquabacterium sp. TaxID=1872578 RepID=UPI002BFE7F87|nr:protein-disulfide reductase DsbD [Aquabacterium sp.]HSW03628.1 protein-disulfide reductase DsbD [Aquabacterium sp.]